MSRARNLPTGDGFYVTACPMCESSPVRDDGTERRGQFNWLLTCTVCGERGCRMCIPDDATVCKGCALAATADT